MNYKVVVDEEEFPKLLEKQESYRNKLENIREIVDDLMKQRLAKRSLIATQEKHVIETDDTGFVNKSICEKISDWWRNV